MAIEANTGLSGTAGTASSGVTIATWANFPAASSVPSGTVYMASDYNNSEWVSDGTYWKPRGGRQRVHVMAATVSSAGTSSEVSTWAPTIPAGMLFPMCNVEIGYVATKTGTAGSTNIRHRYNGVSGTIIGNGGTNGTTAIGFVGFARIVAGVESGGSITLMQGVGGNAVTGTGTSTGGSVTVSHTMSIAVTINLTMQLSSAADSITMHNAYIEVC